MACIHACLVCHEEFWMTLDPVCLPCQFADGIATTAQLVPLWKKRADRTAEREASMEIPGEW